MRLFISIFLALQLNAVGETMTPVTKSDLDPSVYSEWVDGEETVLESDKRNTGPSWVLSTRDSFPGHSGLRFGKSHAPGLRHLRLGFKKKLPVGTVITRGQGIVSVLKPNVVYPGDLANPDHWIAAQLGNSPTQDSTEAFGLWILPPNTQTRALRITHEAKDIDPSYAGHFKGAFIHPERLLNLAEEATFQSSSPRDLAPKFLDLSEPITTNSVRRLVRDEIEAFYEFTVYTSGNPPWPTEDHTGAWIANHSPPQAAAFVPAKNSPTGDDVVNIGSYVTEGPDGLAWVDLDGTNKGGQKWIGGHWTAAPFLSGRPGHPSWHQERNQCPNFLEQQSHRHHGRRAFRSAIHPQSLGSISI